MPQATNLVDAYNNFIVEPLKEEKEFEELGDKSGIASTLHNLGVIRQDQGDHEEAERLYGKSLKIAEALGDKSAIAKSLHNLGTLHEEKGEYHEALEKYQAARDIFHQLGSPYENQAQEGIERMKKKLSKK